jgi:alkanesulfonate monooxygenase SsuD/methylene tetrahydromethanopterin reductase-like flavin-dependent oxidoreductase (luciferase family)
LESVELIKALWTEDSVTYQGEIFALENGVMGPKPVQKPHPPIWLGGGHPDALKRAARMSDGWMGAGGSTTAAFKASVPQVRTALAACGRDPDAFPISKRVFMSVHERADVAEAEVHHWFSVVYHNPDLTAAGGVFGTPAQVREQLEELVAAGANHLLLNPVTRFAEQVEALAEVVGLTATSAR